MDKLEFPNNFFMCGRTKSGKTNLVKYLIREAVKRKQIDYIIVISPSGRVNNDYDFIERRFIHPSLSREFYNKLLRFQRDNGKPHCVLILDDCIGHKFLRQEDGLQSIVAKARHWNISVFILTQNCMDVRNSIREQIHTSYIFKQKSPQSIRNAYQLVADKIESVDEYKKKNIKLKPYQFIYSKLDDDIKIMKLDGVCKKFKIEQ